MSVAHLLREISDKYGLNWSDADKLAILSRYVNNQMASIGDDAALQDHVIQAAAE